MIPWLLGDTPFPPVQSALVEPDELAGLLAAGGDLSVNRLLDAYKQGIFPWYSKGQPILWWSTDPRMVLLTDQFAMPTSLQKVWRQFQRNPLVEFKFDSAFEEVMRACAEPRGFNSGTWITEDIITAYVQLHHLGYAHSSEVWLNGKLVGGAYGVCIGRMFYGESMFTRISNASKVALAQLVFFLKSHQVKMIDCQQETKHLASLGAKPISRQDFIAWVNEAILQPPITEWKMDRF